MKELKIILLLSIPFFTICGGIYHLAYWDTFNINGLAYIELSEIIKTFIYPFVSAIIMFVFGFIIGKYLFPNIYPSKDNKIIPIAWKVINSKWGIKILLVIWLIVISLLYKYGSTNRWISWAMLVGIVPWGYLTKPGVCEFIRDERIQSVFLFVLVFLPLLSFSTGKYKSEQIKNNTKYELITELKLNTSIVQTDSLKILGYTGKFYILSNLKNDNIIIIETDKIKYLKMKQINIYYY